MFGPSLQLPGEEEAEAVKGTRGQVGKGCGGFDRGQALCFLGSVAWLRTREEAVRLEMCQEHVSNVQQGTREVTKGDHWRWLKLLEEGLLPTAPSALLKDLKVFRSSDPCTERPTVRPTASCPRALRASRPQDRYP